MSLNFGQSAGENEKGLGLWQGDNLLALF